MFFLIEEDSIKNKLGITCLYFYASWMPYSKKIPSMINKIEKKYNNINYLGVDVDYFREICNRFNVDSVPTILILVDGKEIKRINGLILTSAFNKIFNDIYVTCNDKINGDCNGKKI